MYKVGDQRFVHSHDLMASIPGREDSHEEKAFCNAYLERREAARHHGTTQIAVLKAQSAIATAFVRASAFKAPRDADLEQNLAAANKTIDRLLAYVPTRAAKIDTARLDELVTALCDSAVSAFPGLSSAVVMSSLETALGTQACHRISIRLTVPGQTTARQVVEGIKSVHRTLATRATDHELAAINLIVEAERAAA
jgi:hypothetical protein